MGLTFTAEQEEFRQTIRNFLAEKSPEREIRRLMETREGYDPAVWAQMADQLGLQGLAIPEAFGGSGFSFVETAIALQEAGRALVCAPFLSGVIASLALLEFADDTAKKEFLPPIAAGTAVATVAIAEPSGSWAVDATTTEALQTDGDWTLTGTKSYVLDGHLADTLIVVARHGAELGLFTVDATAPQITRELVDTFDQTRKLATIEMRSVPAQPLGEFGAPSEFQKLELIAAVALANEQAGLSERIMEMAVDYAKERIQFGRAIGSFQAIKHKCADLLVAVESSKSAAYVAAEALANGDPSLLEVAPLAASFCSEAALFVAHENIQIHGAIAYTWEYPAHLYYRRAKSSELLFGDTAWHRERLASVIGL